jgi:hypothetical protein
VVQISASPVGKFLRIAESLVISLYILEVLDYIKRYKRSLKQNVSIQGHNTCSKLNFHVEFCNTVLFQKSEVNMGIKLHNRVLESIKNLDNFKFLKKELKSLILSHSFHSVYEFLQSWVKLVCKVYLLASSCYDITPWYCVVLDCVMVVIVVSCHIDHYFMTVTVPDFVYIL